MSITHLALARLSGRFCATSMAIRWIAIDLKGKTFEEFVSHEEQLREKNKLSIKQLSDELQSKITEKEKFEKGK